MLRIVQIQKGKQRRVAVVDEPSLRLVAEFDSLYAMASAAIDVGVALSALVRKHVSDQHLDYDAIYNGTSEWRLRVPLDHPIGPAGTLVSGTGLTHFGSARDRQAMHAKSEAQDEQNLTDSMKMFRWGVDGGRPAAGQIGVAPEWFYKGNGSILRAHGDSLEIPAYAEDGGEEAEIAGLYVVSPDGLPRRVGMAAGNEFSDHQFEKRNYLNLAGSKVRTCAIGPEIVIDPGFDSITGEVRIERNGAAVWAKAIRTGEAEMFRRLWHIEHHHFKFASHRVPGDVHVHFFGAHSLSFGDGVQLLDGDVMAIGWNGFGRPLRNAVRVCSKGSDKPVSVISIG
jgi:hypothetical protein